MMQNMLLARAGQRRCCLEYQQRRLLTFRSRHGNLDQCFWVPVHVLAMRYAVRFWGESLAFPWGSCHVADFSSRPWAESGSPTLKRESLP